MRETVLELWIACHMPRGQYIVIYERKGPRAQRAKRALRREARLAARLAARLQWQLRRALRRSNLGVEIEVGATKGPEALPCTGR